MENLNKENFFNALQDKFPKGMKIFCDWIDEYKKKNNWDSLFKTPDDKRPEANSDPFFNVGLDERQKEWDARKIKYHNLPIAFQIGIWIEFVCSRGGCQWEIDDLFSHDWKDEISKYIEMMHEDELISNS